MLLRFDLRCWAARESSGDPIEYVVASTEEEAAAIIYQVTELDEFSLVEVNPLNGEEL